MRRTVSARIARTLAAIITLGPLAFAALSLDARPALAQKNAPHEEIALAVGETKTISAVGVKE